MSLPVGSPANVPDACCPLPLVVGFATVPTVVLHGSRFVFEYFLSRSYRCLHLLNRWDGGVMGGWFWGATVRSVGYVDVSLGTVGKRRMDLVVGGALANVSNTGMMTTVTSRVVVVFVVDATVAVLTCTRRRSRCCGGDYGVGTVLSGSRCCRGTLVLGMDDGSTRGLGGLVHDENFLTNGCENHAVQGCCQ